MRKWCSYIVSFTVVFFLLFSDGKAEDLANLLLGNENIIGLSVNDLQEIIGDAEIIDFSDENTKGRFLQKDGLDAFDEHDVILLAMWYNDALQKLELYFHDLNAASLESIIGKVSTKYGEAVIYSGSMYSPDGFLEQYSTVASWDPERKIVEIYMNENQATRSTWQYCLAINPITDK